jgi:hypothetical protein
MTLVLSQVRREQLGREPSIGHRNFAIGSLVLTESGAKFIVGWVAGFGVREV